MNIDWTHVTPWSALPGGVLIGTAAAMFALFNGRIAGVSSIVGGLLSPLKGDVAWRLAFAAGLIAAPLCYALIAPLPAIRIEAGTSTLLVAGLITGLGTRLGYGCTSGHGVCGISRLSPRSMLATGCFMASGFVTVLVVRHLLAAG